MEANSGRSNAVRPAATLFDGAVANDREEYLRKIRAFATEVAKRHRRERGDANALLIALRGWHRSWSICAPGRVPVLDDEAMALAVSAYERSNGRRRSEAA